MKKLLTSKYTFGKIILCGIFLAISAKVLAQNNISLAGKWHIKLDRQNVGLQQQWFNDSFSNSLQLPGSIQEQGYGNKPSLDTDWTATNYKQFFELDKYAPYRTDDNFKMPYWLTPEYYYKGVTWFQKEVTIPDDWKDKRITLELERTHWGTTVFVDDQQAGADSSLTTPHRYNLSQMLAPGNHTITVRVDNRMLYDVGKNAHSVSDHTQTNWNGIIGNIKLQAGSPLFIDDVEIYPDVKQKMAHVKVYLKNQTGTQKSGTITLSAASKGETSGQSIPSVQHSFTIDTKDSIKIDYPMGENSKLWDSFHPNLYSMEVKLDSDSNLKDEQSIAFGMRSFKVNGKRFSINDKPVFLRGTLECAIFPKTGYPSTKKSVWAHRFEVIKQHGLNHVRFHSWCPPEAAFDAADEAGMYLQVEGPSWANQGATIGDGKPLDQFIIDESKRIMKEYGNHPSFVMFAYGNEPSGDHHEEYLADFVSMWKKKDDRRVYTSASGWPVLPENDFQDIPAPRIQAWGQELKSVINAERPSTDWDFREVIQKQDQPVVGHEIGQWDVYPNFDEMSKYTGVLYPRNFEIFRDFLKQNHMLDQDHDFLMASGKLQVLSYKADLEAALRTPNYAGYQMLQLHDFPGQGTALVGILDPFFDSKPYVNAAEFSRYTSPTVPLARMPKRILTNDESFKADLEIAHFTEKEDKNVPVSWQVTNNQNHIVADGSSEIDLPIGNNIPAGSVNLNLSEFDRAQKLNLEVSVGDLGQNDWDFWVYPQQVTTSTDNIITANALTADIEQKLKNGATVILKLDGKLKEGKGKNIMAGFSTIFWNTAWTGGQAPHTMGILVDPSNPLFNDFPTEYYTNWQWWDIVHDVHPMIMDDFPADLTPSIQMIDTWFDAHKLGLLFETTVGKGKLVVTSIDFDGTLDDTPATRQLYHSLIAYMKSDAFHPEIQINLDKIKSLYE